MKKLIKKKRNMRKYPHIVPLPFLFEVNSSVPRILSLRNRKMEIKLIFRRILSHVVNSTG